MSKSSYMRLRRFRGSVQKVIETVKANRPFYSEDGQQIPARDDLSYVVSILKRCRKRTWYRGSTRMYMIAASVEYAIAVFCGKGALSSVEKLTRYFMYILNGKISGEYRYRADLLLFLVRLRNKTGNMVTLVRQASSEKTTDFGKRYV